MYVCMHAHAIVSVFVNIFRAYKLLILYKREYYYLVVSFANKYIFIRKYCILYELCVDVWISPF